MLPDNPAPRISQLPQAHQPWCRLPNLKATWSQTLLFADFY